MITVGLSAQRQGSHSVHPAHQWDPLVVLINLGVTELLPCGHLDPEPLLQMQKFIEEPPATSPSCGCNVARDSWSL